jgi:hypothetical protein
MNPTDFIISKLKSFIEDFTQTRVRYENDVISDTHFIEVIPNEVYHIDEAYIQWEGDMFDEFVELYPYENICFISDDAIVGLQNIDFEIYGKYFEVLYTTTRDSIQISEEVLKITSSRSSESSGLNEYFSQRNKEVHVEEVFGYTHIQPDYTPLLAA